MLFMNMNESLLHAYGFGLVTFYDFSLQENYNKHF